jgi:two-component system, OmpR family, response regulator
MRVLVIEDEAKVAQAIAGALSAKNYFPDIASNGEDGWFKGSTEQYAAIVLDLGLPNLDGLTILKRWRAEGIKTPVIVLSARGTWAERVDGIDNGADDYLPKPFEMTELLARVRALLRRAGGLASSLIEAGALRIDVRANEAFLDGQPLALTPLEFRLLYLLALNQDRQVPKEELAEQLYAVNHEREGGAIEALVSRVRRKIGKEMIESKRGYGYKLSATPS